MPPGNPLFNDPDKHPGRLTQFSETHQPETQGRTPGVKTRSTIARKILEMTAVMPDEMFAELKASFPDIEQRMTTEEIATIAMLGAAIAKKDVQAYKAIMDSAYGAPKQDIEQKTTMEITEAKITFR